MNDKSKVLDRIQKLLAMAADTSSPQEAAIAARRAAAMLRDHQLDEADVLIPAMERGERMSTATTGRKCQRKASTWQGQTVFQIGRLMGCVVNWVWEGEYKKIRFSGETDDVKVAVWMTTYLFDVLDRLAKQEKRNHPALTRKDVISFRHGFTSGLALQVNAILAERAKIEAQAVSGSRELALINKFALVEEHFGRQTSSQSKRSYDVSGLVAFNEGVKQGERVSLNRQIEGGGNTQYLNG